jgi:hypothetical protein
MNQFAVTSPSFPKFTVLAHTMTGALAKAESISVKLYGEKATSEEFTVKLAKRNIR